MAAPQEHLSTAAIQKRFNEGRYFERCMDDSDESVHLGEIVDIGPAPPNFPTSIRSQMVAYLDQWDRTVMWAHQHGRSDGTPAEGTRPDPKFLFEGGVRYKHDKRLDLLDEP
jgi:hypothetical protein